jgi:hypothetical protein
VSPHAADVYDRAAVALLDHAANHGLGEEEDGPVQSEVGVIGGAVEVQERLGDEEPGRVHQQGGVGVLAGQLLADPVHLLSVGQVGSDAVGCAVLGQCLDDVVDSGGSWPMMTALPPAATTSAAVWRPIPLLPPTTISFCPAKTGTAIGRPGSSMWWCRPSSQFTLI